jgi:hypothetical protein
VQLVSVVSVAVDVGRELLSYLGLLALVPSLVEIFVPEISPANDLNDSLIVEAKEIADGFRRELFLSKLVDYF